MEIITMSYLLFMYKLKFIICINPLNCVKEIIKYDTITQQ